MKKFLFCCLFLSCSSLMAQVSFSQIKALIKMDDADGLAVFLEAYPDIDACYEYGGSTYSLLILSIKYNAEAVFKACLIRKADPNLICEDKTPLMYAIKYGRKDYFHALLKQGADAHLQSHQGKTAYQYAEKYEQTYFLPYLKE